MIPRDSDATWAAIENVIQKGNDSFAIHSKPTPPPSPSSSKKFPADGELNSWKKDFTDEAAIETPQQTTPTEEDMIDEWTSDIDDLEKEIKAQS